MMLLYIRCFLWPFDHAFVRCRMVVVANHLPLRAIADPSGGHRFEWDEDSLLAQAKVFIAFSPVSLGDTRSARYLLDPASLFSR